MRELRTHAQKSANLNDNSLSIPIIQIITQIELLDSDLFKTELEMEDIVICLHFVIMIISSVGFVNDGMIRNEVGDTNCIPTSNKLRALAGLDSTVY